MKTTRFLGSAVAALSLLTTSAAFAAAPVRPAASLGVTSGVQRASTPISDSNKLFGAPIIAAIFAISILVVGVVVVVDDNDSPTSP